MSPPKLARDAPWLDIIQPVVINFLATFWHDLHITIAHSIQSWPNDLVGIYEPLVRQQRLDHNL